MLLGSRRIAAGGGHCSGACRTGNAAGTALATDLQRSGADGGVNAIIVAPARHADTRLVDRIIGTHTHTASTHAGDDAMLRYAAHRIATATTTRPYHRRRRAAMHFVMCANCSRGSRRAFESAPSLLASTARACIFMP